jgi:hypothetical protein
MTACEDFIQDFIKDMPNLVTTRDLIKYGFYKTDQAAASARRRGNGPEFFKLNGRVIVYPLKGIVEFLRKSQCKPKIRNVIGYTR